MSTYIVGSFNQLNNILGIWWQNSNFWFWNHLWEFLGKTWNVKSVKSPTIFAPQADRKWKVHLIYLVHRLNILCHCKNRLNPVFFQLHSKLSNRGVVLEIFGEWRRDEKENKVICMCVWGVSVYINASMDFISLFSVQSDFFCPYSKQLKERGKHWMLINLIHVLLRSWTKLTWFHTYHLSALDIKIVFHVTLFIIGFQYTGQLSVPSHMESSISGKHNQPSAVAVPTNFVLNNISGSIKTQSNAVKINFG